MTQRKELFFAEHVDQIKKHSYHHGYLGKEWQITCPFCEVPSTVQAWLKRQGCRFCDATLRLQAVK